MLRLLPFLLVMTGCKSCAERRAERAEARAMDVLLPALEVEPVEVVAEVEEREDGGVEAWGTSSSRDLRAPAGWVLELTFEELAWAALDCPDDVPLAMSVSGAWTTEVTDDYGLGLQALAGGCDADGDDIRGDYDAGFTVDVEATSDEGDSYSLSLVVPVELSIK